MGGAGFIGSAVVKELLKYGVDVFVIVRPGFSKRETSRLVGLNVHTVECDMKEICSLPIILQERSFDAWYQFAWDGLFGDDLIDYHKQIHNIEYLLNAVQVAKEINCKKFIGSGSVWQYELLVGSHSGDKRVYYKAAKTACQYMGKTLSESLGIDVIWPIITNIYGVGENSPRLINSMIRNLQAGKHQPLSKGDQICDFIYITDAAKAFRLIGEKGKHERVYVIAQGRAQPLIDLLTVVRDVVAPKAELGFGELKSNGYYIPKKYYNTQTLFEDTGFIPDVSFSEGIQLTSEWIKQQEAKV